ncbi:hypothetical protein JOQ06_006515, partial [Pogonophryne albipinna]
GKSDAITAVKLLSCFDDLVAVGTASGRVAVFQLLRRFDVVGLHKGSVTALAWSTNGMKLFSGDDKGRVVFSSLDLDQGVCKPMLLLEESSGVVQVEYSHQVLLISTHHRSLLYCTQKQEVMQLGSNSGRYGACFLPALCKQSDLQVFAARPGLRLWRSDVRGQVEDTRLLRALFSTQIPQFELFPRPGPIGAYRPAERQLGLLSCFLREGWILSWNEYSVYVLDCVNEVIVGALESSGDIVSVSCCDNEIFILKGDRDIIRLSSSPEGQASSCEYQYYTVPHMVDVHLSSPLATPTTLPPIGSEDMKLVVKAVRVKKKRRRHTDSSSGSRLSESSCSDSMFVVQDGSCSEGGSGTPLSDRTSLIGLDLQNQDSPEQDQNLPDALHGAVESGSTPPPDLQGLQNQQNPAETVPPTPDVDLLLECTFSYMHNTDGGGQEQQPMEDQDQFLSPLIGRENEEAKDEDLAAPSGLAEQMFYFTVSSLDRKPSLSSDEDGDIYCPTTGRRGDNLNGPSSETTDRQVEQDPQDRDTHRPDQLAESWMGYSGPGCGILSLQVTDRYVWCLDFKGGLFCSSLPETGLNWQRFEDNVHQVAVSPSGNLLWKVEQKTLTAFACAKVSAKGKRHWYKATEQTAFVALSDDSAWIIRTNGDLYLQTGLSVERPCARSVQVDVPCVFSQVCVSGGAVWALSEHKALFYREGVTSYCSEGGGWKYDTVSEAQGLDLMCVSLAEGGTAWALDASGSLWFRTGICPSRPQGEDDHWWQVESVCLSHSLPVPLSACLTLCLSHSLPVCLSHSLPVSLSACPTLCLSHSLPVPLSACLSVPLSACLNLCLSHSLPVCLSHSLPVSPSACPTLCLSHSLPVSLSACPTLCLSHSLLVPLSACLSVPLSACLNLCLSHSLPVCLSHTLPVSLSACPTLCLSVCPTLCLSHPLPVPLSACLSVPLSACPTLCLSHSLPVSLSAGLSVPLSACLTLCLSHSLPVCLSHSLSVSLSACPTLCLSVCPTLCLSHSLPVPLSACLTLCLSHSLPVSLSACLTLCLSHSLPVPLSACLSVPLSSCPTLCLSHSLPVPLSACLTLCLSHSLPVCLSHSLPVSLSACPTLCLSVCPTLCLSHSLPVSLSACLTLCLSHSLSVPLSACLTLCLSHSLPVPLSACLTLCLSHSLPVPLSACLTLCLSACLTLCLSHSLSVPLSACLTLCLSHSLPVPLSACLTLCLSACLTLCLSVCPTICLSHSLPHSLPVCLSHSLPVSLSACLSVSLSACLSVPLSACPTLCLFVCPTLCLSVCPTLCLSACPTLCLSVPLSACLSVPLSTCPTLCLPVPLSVCLSHSLPVCLSHSLSVPLSTCPTLCLSVCLSHSLSVCLSHSLPVPLS